MNPSGGLDQQANPEEDIVARRMVKTHPSNSKETTDVAAGKRAQRKAGRLKRNCPSQNRGAELEKAGGSWIRIGTDREDSTR